MVVSSLFTFDDLVEFYKERTIQESQKRKPPKGQNIPWRLHVGYFWKLPFIRHPKKLGVRL